MAETALAPLHVAPPNLVLPGRYIVVLKDAASKTSQASMSSAERAAWGRARADEAQQVADAYGVPPDFVYGHALNGFAGELTSKQLDALRRDERVAFVEEVVVVSVNPVAVAETVGTTATSTPPSWGLDRINQRLLPLDTSFNSRPADKVHVYVVDSGIRASHVEFAGRVGAGKDYINDGKGTNDCNGHGSHVAGTALGATVGVAPTATVHAVRVLGCDGSGFSDQVAAGLNWIAANRLLPAVANMSLGGCGKSPTTDTAVRGVISSGVLVIRAAGNAVSGCNGGVADDACKHDMGAVAEAMVVGNSTSYDYRAESSYYGQCLDLFAPGYSIYSAGISSNASYVYMTGTSMAAPHVAGVAANYLQQNPSATPAQVHAAIVNGATQGVLSGVNGSPNRLLFSNFPFGSASKLQKNGFQSVVQSLITEESCMYAMSPVSKTVTNLGGQFSVKVTTQSGCTWAASSNATWLSIISGQAGSGNGVIAYSVGANTEFTTRQAVIKLSAGASALPTHTVKQKPQPGISINNVSAAEGAAGTTKTMTFTVKLNVASKSTVTVNYATANGTATAGTDYTSKSGTLSFAAGQLSKTVSIVIKGDGAVEPNETFRVLLTNPTAPYLLKQASGTGTIVNDD